MVKKQLTQKEKDLQYIQRRIKYIEKMGVDTTHLPKLTKRHSQAKITDLRLHLEKNTQYRFTKIKSSQGEVLGHVSQAEMFIARNRATKTLKDLGFKKIGTAFEGKKKVPLYGTGKAQFTVRQLANYMASIGRVKGKIESYNEVIDITKQAYQIFAEDRGMKDPIKSKEGDKAKVKLSNPLKVEGEKGLKLLDVEMKAAMEFSLDKLQQEMYGDLLTEIASIWGTESDIMNRLRKLDYTDLEILRSMFRNDNDFYATMYGSDGQGDRSEDIKRDRADKLKQKLDELEILRKDKENFLKKRDMTLGGRN